MRPVEIWLNDDQLRSIFSNDYWNDPDQETKKAWWIVNGDHQKCINYLKSSGLLAEFERASVYVSTGRDQMLRVADLAAGIGWTSVLLSRLPNVKEVHAVEISRHRLGGLFEQCVKVFNGDVSKLFRYLGSFYDLKFEDQSMDIVFLSQAFHHANNPLALLVECDRVLKPGGRIILTGEEYVGMGQIVRRFLSVVMRDRKFVVDFRELFPPDRVMGDHCYKISDYYCIFRLMGYQARHLTVGKHKMIFIADKLLQQAGGAK